MPHSAGLGVAVPIPGHWLVMASLVALFFAVRGARKMNQAPESGRAGAKRPGSGGGGMSRCFLLLVDGLRPDVADARLAAGDLPHLSAMLEPGGRTPAITVFPSTTSVAYLPFLTGCTPGRCNIPSIRWLDRRATAAAGGATARRSEATAATRRRCSTATSRRDVRTIFELVPESVGIFTPIARGLTPARDPSRLRAPALGIGGAFCPLAPAIRRRRLPSPPARGGRGLAIRLRPVSRGGRLHPPDDARLRAGAARAEEGGCDGRRGAASGFAQRGELGSAALILW